MGSIVKHWSNEPFIRGSYSGSSLHSTEWDYHHLAEPVGGCLFFAGEAAYVTMPANVDSAVKTGERASQEVISELQKHDLLSHLL